MADEEGVNLVLSQELIAFIATPFLCLIDSAQTLKSGPRDVDPPEEMTNKLVKNT